MGKQFSRLHKNSAWIERSTAQCCMVAVWLASKANSVEQAKSEQRLFSITYGHDDNALWVERLLRFAVVDLRFALQMNMTWWQCWKKDHMMLCWGQSLNSHTSTVTDVEDCKRAIHKIFLASDISDFESKMQNMFHVSIFP